MACTGLMTAPLAPGIVDATGVSTSPIYQEAPVQPTKLFIGGISRRTTTKQLRDHFSRFGRVLDSVAMRQPDGRPRGFGYVTLASPAAAERALSEPQMIDERLVDLKLAVPDPVGNAKGNGLQPVPYQETPHAWRSGMEYDMRTPLATMPLLPDGSWSWSQWSHTVVPQMSKLLAPPASFSPSSQMLPPGLHLTSPGTCSENTSPTELLNDTKLANSTKRAARAKIPLGEVTNIVNDESLELKGGSLKGIPEEAKRVDSVRPLSVKQLDRTSMITPSSLLDIYIDPIEEKPAQVSFGNPKGPETDNDEVPVDSPNQESNLLDVAPSDTSQEEGSESQCLDDEYVQNGMQGIDSQVALPSVGSAAHFTNECRRCNFFAKGRCQNGRDCAFCHFPHDRRKLSRQEKRELKAASLSAVPTPTSQASQSSTPSAVDVCWKGGQQCLDSGDMTSSADVAVTATVTARATAAEIEQRTSRHRLPPGLEPPGLAPPAPSPPSNLQPQVLGQLSANVVLPQWGSSVGAPLLATGPPATPSTCAPLKTPVATETQQKELRTTGTQTEGKYVICGCCGRLAKAGTFRCHV